MSDRQANSLFNYLRGLVGGAKTSAQPDAQLVEAFLRHQDHAAFAALLYRYGPLVLGVCRRVLHDAHEADDAFQATFLIFVRKAGSISRRESVGSWLCGVAHRVAVRARAQAQRRQAQQRQVEDIPMRDTPDMTWQEWRPILDEEINRLPTRYRVPFVLCQLEGKTNEEAARQLGCPVGTIWQRLSRARQMLRGRLARRGVAVSAAAVASTLTPDAVLAQVPAELAEATMKTALGLAGAGAAGPTALAEGVLKTMWLNRLTTTAALLLTLAITGTGTGMLVLRGVISRPEVVAAGPEGPATAAVDSVIAVPDAPADALPAGAVARLGSARLRHGNTITSGAFAPDGKVLATGGLDSKVRLWNWETGAERSVLDVGGLVYAVAFADEGKTLIVGSGLGPTAQIRRWEVATGKPQGVLVKAKNQFSATADGKLIAYMDSLPGEPKANNRVLKVMESAGSTVRFEVVQAGPGFAFSADGTAFGVGTLDGAVLIHDCATGQLRRRLTVENGTADAPENAASVGAVAFSPDGKWLAAGLGDSTVRVIDLANGSQRSPLKGHQLQRNMAKVDSRDPWFHYYGVRALLFSPDSGVLASLAADNQICLWTPATGKMRPVEGRPGFVLFSPDSRSLAEGGQVYNQGGSAIRLWDVATAKESRSYGNATAAVSLEFAPDGRRLATATRSEVRLWDPVTGKHLAAPFIGAELRQLDFGPKFAPDGRSLVWIESIWTARDAASRHTEYQKLVRWDVTANTPISSFEIEGKQPAVRPAAIPGLPVGLTPGGEMAIIRAAQSSKTQQRILLVDTRTGARQGLLRSDHYLVSFTPDTFLSAGINSRTRKAIELDEVVSARRILEIERPRTVNHIALSPDGRTLASLECDMRVRTLPSSKPRNDSMVEVPRLCLIDLATGRELHAIDLGREIEVEKRGGVLCFSPDGRLLAAGYPEDRLVHVLDVGTGKELRAFAGHLGSIQALSFSPDGKRLASASVDTTVLIWDVSGLRPEAVPAAPEELTEAQLAGLWQELAHNDVRKAYEAMSRLATAPTETVAFLRAQLKPVPSAVAQRIEQLVKDLESNQFAVRQKASDELAKLGRTAVPYLARLLATQPALEVRMRAEKLLEQVADNTIPPEPDTLRVLRAVHLLEFIASGESRQLLTELAKGATAWETEAAQQAVQRLNGR